VTITGRIPRDVRTFGLALAVPAFAIPLLVDFGGLSEGGHRVMAIFLVAIVLWVTEAIPLYATAALVILLEVTLVSDQALWALPGAEAAPDYATYFQTLAHPVLMLFLGGFFLASGASKFRLDRNLARVLLRPFGTSPRAVMLGLMLVTAVFSMFMSNTATTATMLAVVLPLMAALPPGDRLRAGLALSIPVAANIGGIATPVGTPPNAIAVGSLADAGITVGFGKWMLLATPATIVLLGASWLVLSKLFPSGSDTLEVSIGGRFDRSRGAVVFYMVFAVTVLLWLTESLHGIPSAVVGFAPVVVLLSTRVFDTEDLQRVPWHVLWLVGGGIALGIGVAETGLDAWLVEQVDWSALGSAAVLAVLALFALAMSTVVSNSAAANLLIPIGLALALSEAVDVEPVSAGFFIAVGASLAMALPISTPPNAIAYSTGVVATRDMVVVGALVGGMGIVLFLWVGPLLWNLMGVAP